MWNSICLCARGMRLIVFEIERFIYLSNTLLDRLCVFTLQRKCASALVDTIVSQSVRLCICIGNANGISAHLQGLITP